MRLCDVVVHASIVGEPFGMTVIEGMATATPVVAANKGGPTEIIEDGVTGLLVDPTDAGALSEAIIGLLRDPEKAARIGNRGAARTRAHYSAERYATDVERLYEQWLPAPSTAILIDR
jgi:glycosyltransferase involved in cell wall biosynthesis